LKTILALHSSADLYGSDRSLLRLVTGGLEFQFIVVLPYEGPLCAALREKGVAVYVHPLAVIRRRLFTPWGLVGLAFQLVRQTWFLRNLILEEEVDLVMANTTAVLGGEWAAALCGRPYLQYVREIIVKPKLVAKFFSWRARWATRVLCVSEGTRNNFVAQDPVIADKTFVLNNGIEVGKFEAGERSKVRKELGIDDDTVLVGAIGRISPFKGMDFLVDAAAAYFRLKPEARVRFVVVGSAFGEKKPVHGSSFLVPGCGEGELLPAERALVDRMVATGFGDRISWQPFRADVADVLAALDVFVLPSMLPDPLPTVVLEAMAAGKSVIGTRMGGVPEMVVEDGEQETGDRRQGTGILVEGGDVAGLAVAIGRLVEDAGLRQKMGLAGARRCREHFSVEGYLGKVVGHLHLKD
jgi:glycosyltransferase involved in cell wall biosynthesis